MSQYSFASYSGNAENTNNLKRTAEKHLKWVKQRNDFFRPKVFLPFASGIKWCANENNYLNEYSVKADDVENILMSSKTPPLILKPHTNKTIAIKNMSITSEDLRLEVIHEESPRKDKLHSNSDEIKPPRELNAIAFSARTKLNRQNLMMTTPLMHALGAIHALERVLVEVNLTSNQKTYYELRPGLRLCRLRDTRQRNIAKYRSHIAMSIDSLTYCFSHQFGAETLWVNSRFQILKGAPKSYFKHFYFSILANQGFFFPFGYIMFVWNRILKPRFFQ